MRFSLPALLLVAVVTASRIATAQSVNCGVPPQRPMQSQEEEKIKGDLQGKAQFLTRLLANGNFQGAVEAERKTIYQSTSGLQAAWQAAYLSYIFCSTVVSDQSLSSQEKLNAILSFRQGMCTVPQGLLIKLAELVQGGSAIQSHFIQTDDAATIQNRYQEWDSMVEKFLSENLGVTFLVEFTTAHGDGVMPSNHSVAGGSIWAEIQAKNASLTTIIQELRRC